MDTENGELKTGGVVLERLVSGGCRWHLFDEKKGFRQKRPPLRKWVAVILEPEPSHVIDLGVKLKPEVPGLVASYPPGVAIGYRKDAAGDETCPYFVVPGIGRKVIAWCDCLPADFGVPKAANATEMSHRQNQEGLTDAEK